VCMRQSYHLVAPTPRPLGAGMIPLAAPRCWLSAREGLSMTHRPPFHATVDQCLRL
jgi:hypothetical protein